MPNNQPGHTYERDEHGEYDVDAGSTVPVDGRCNAVLWHTQERYGEVRYCTRLPENVFIEDGSEFCRTHKGQKALMDHNSEVKSMAFITSYLYIFDRLEPHKRIIAIEMYRSFLGESLFNFESEDTEYVIDLSEANWTNEDEYTVQFPVPTEHVARARALWFACLEYMRMESISEKIFKDAYQSHNAIGERVGVVASGEHGPVEDDVEHHLNLPLSRIIKDHKDLLRFGGVPLQSDGEAGDSFDRDWVFVIDPDEEKDTPGAVDDRDPFVEATTKNDE